MINYFHKTNMLTRPFTLLGIEGQLVQTPGKGGLWVQQAFMATREFKGQGGLFHIMVSYDRGHESNTKNHFAIVGDFDGSTGFMKEEECAKFWPELEHLVTWHISTEGEPFHYVANTLYYAQQGELDKARWTARWPDAPEGVMFGSPEALEQALLERLPYLKEEFRQVLEATGLGFTPQEQLQ